MGFIAIMVIAFVFAALASRTKAGKKFMEEQ